MPAIVSSRAPGMARAVAAPPVGWTIRSRSPWITKVGTSMWRSSAVRSPERKIAASCRAVPALVGSRSQPMAARSRTRSSSNGKPCEPMWRKIARSRSIASRGVRGGLAVANRRHVDSAGRPMRGAPRGGHDRRQRAHPARIVRGHGLRDHAAHRDAGQMHIPVAERVEQPDGVTRHVAEVVLPRMVASAKKRKRLRRRKVHMRRPPDVAIVESGDAVAAAGQRGDEVGRP